MTDEERELREQLAHATEQLAEYRGVVGYVVVQLGHVGDEPVDLTDALEQIERLIKGEDLERTDLEGIAEDVRKLRLGAQRLVAWLQGKL